MPRYRIIAERTFTLDYGITVEADNEHGLRVQVEQLNDELEEWEDKEECLIENWHYMNEMTPSIIEIKEIKDA